MQQAPYPPTAIQLALLRYIAGYQLAHDGISPSTAEMATNMGLVGKGGIRMHLRGLQDRGHLHIIPRRARAIRLLTNPTVPHAPDGAPLFAVPLKGTAHGPAN